MLPTRRLAFFAFAATLLAVGAGLVPALRAPLFALDTAIVLASLVDLLLAIARGPRVEVDREAAAIFSVGRPNHVTVRLRNRSGRTLRGIVADDPLGESTTHGCPARFELEPYGRTSLRYEIVPSRRGKREFGAVTLRYVSPLGLVARQERTTLPAVVDVYPDVHAARSLELLRRQGRQDSRIGSLRALGGDTEFERLRPHQRGDTIRHVDWRASARRDDLTVRQYQAESNQNVVFAIDVGRAMRGESGGLTAIDHALNAALLTAHVALRAGDRAGLMVFDEAPRQFVRPEGGHGGARKLTRAAYALDAGLAATDYRSAMTFLRTHVRSRSLFVILTNLLDPRSARDLASSLRGLLPKHLPLCVLLRDTDVEALVTAPARDEADLYAGAAAAETLASRDDLVRGMRKDGILVLDVAPAQLTPELVQGYLDVKARRLL